MIRVAGFVLVWMCCGVAAGQKTEFVTAAVSVSPPVEAGKPMRVGVRGGPESDDPNRVTIERMNLFKLLTAAYDVKIYQVSGPQTLFDGRFNITATLPEGSTKEQFRAMLQKLLA